MSTHRLSSLFVMLIVCCAACLGLSETAFAQDASDPAGKESTSEPAPAKPAIEIGAGEEVTVKCKGTAEKPCEKALTACEIDVHSLACLIRRDKWRRIQIHRIEKDIADLRAKWGEHDARIAQLESDMVEMTKLFISLNEAVATNSDAIADLNRRFVEALAAMDARIKDLERENAEQNRRLDEHDDWFDQLATTLSSANPYVDLGVGGSVLLGRPVLLDESVDEDGENLKSEELNHDSAAFVLGRVDVGLTTGRHDAGLVGWYGMGLDDEEDWGLAGVYRFGSPQLKLGLELGVFQGAKDPTPAGFSVAYSGVHSMPHVRFLFSKHGAVKASLVLGAIVRWTEVEVPPEEVERPMVAKGFSGGLMGALNVSFGGVTELFMTEPQNLDRPVGRADVSHR